MQLSAGADRDRLHSHVCGLVHIWRPAAEICRGSHLPGCGAGEQFGVRVFGNS